MTLRALNGVFPGTVFADGFVAGTWELTGQGATTTTMRMHPYGQLRAVDDVVAEGNRLLESTFGVTHPQVEIAC